MTRQSEHQAKRRAEGHRKVQFIATPATVAALVSLCRRTGLSATGAVNAAIVAHEEATRPDENAGRPFTPDEIELMRKMALEGDLRHARELLDSFEEATRG